MLAISFIVSTGILFMLASCAGSVNGMTLQLLADVSKKVARNRNKEQVRQLKAILPIRIRFSNNYVDMLTPLVMMNFCLEQIASLLLMKL